MLDIRKQKLLFLHIFLILVQIRTFRLDGEMKLSIIMLCFLFVSCTRPTCIHSIDWEEFSKAVREGEDCEEMASCGPGKGLDKGLLSMCLAEKEKLKKKNK